MDTGAPTAAVRRLLVPVMLALATGGGLGLFPGDAPAQSSTTLSVTARIVAPCTITSRNLESTCSGQTLARQSDIRNGEARITRSGDETTVTHKGGPPPRMEKLGDRFLVRF